jgi:adenylylsulfate kinase-like enzyme
VRALLLTGPPGAGKTTTLTRLMGHLEAHGLAYAAVEVEALALVHPWPDDDAAFEHLRFVAGSFARRGYPLLLTSATVVDLDYLERTRAALPTDDVLTVRLEAPAEVLRDRLVRREPPDWVGLPRLLDAVTGIAQTMLTLPGVDLVVDTEAHSADEVVAMIAGALAG